MGKLRRTRLNGRGVIVAIPLLAAALCYPIRAQETPATDLQRALAGSWAGILEYRDFSAPSGSTKRVKLPTWLSIERSGSDLRFRYIYHDGPSKTVTESSLIRFDSDPARYTVTDPAGKVVESYGIAGLGQLRQGRGSLTLTGSGTENKALVQVRVTLRIGRNLLEIARETALSGQQFTLRHAYTLVRAAPPRSQGNETRN